MASTLSVRPDRTIIAYNPVGSVRHRTPTRRPHLNSAHVTAKNHHRPRWSALFSLNRRLLASAPQSGSRADDSAPSEMSLENALKVLGISEGASFEDIVRAKNSILAGCKDDQQTIAKVEAAYDTLLMQSLSQRRAGKVVSSSIRYADVKPVSAPKMGSMPQWLRNSVSVEAPTTGELGIQAGVYGALMVLTYVNGAASSAAPYAGVDVPGLVLASSFGATLYFITKKNVKFGKASVITIGGLVAGAVVGSVVENWLQVDIVPLFGIHSPATVVSEFVLLSQFLVSLYLR
ncbi:hypothetical protein ACH5RR_021878 [Cinchona calisaya]|uniref:Protein CHAPERONE-LIKE PROTEIN OF POR1, chloroplastic n=1 Tax=Cinchona calisaya TaxID=153742 RepID=A0ABD2Z823_9GENT